MNLILRGDNQKYQLYAPLALANFSKEKFDQNPLGEKYNEPHG
jgi:hypothetical protein